MPDGLNLPSSAITAAFHGDIPLPEVNPVEMLGASLGFQVEGTCNFDDVTAKIYQEAGSNARVYVSTRALAEVLSPEHAADATTKAILSGGSTIKGTTDELARACLNELNGAYAFLQQAAAAEPQKILGNVMAAILTGKRVETASLEIKPFVAEMNYTVRAAGSSDLLNYLPELQKKIDNLGMTFPFQAPRFCDSRERPAGSFRERARRSHRERQGAGHRSPQSRSSRRKLSAG